MGFQRLMFLGQIFIEKPLRNWIYVLNLPPQYGISIVFLYIMRK